MQVDEQNPPSQNPTAEEEEEEESTPEEGHFEIERLSKIRRVGTRHPSKKLAYQYEVLVHWKGY